MISVKKGIWIKNLICASLNHESRWSSLNRSILNYQNILITWVMDLLWRSTGRGLHWTCTNWSNSLKWTPPIMWDRSKTRCTACTAGCSLATDTTNVLRTDRGERGRGAAAAGGLIIMIAVGRGDIAMAKPAHRNDCYGPFINIQFMQYLAQMKIHQVYGIQTDYYCTL